jgi:glycosyltransferase involved in cell wall biosynthesis
MNTHHKIRKLLFVTPRYFPYSGGIEMHVHELAGRFTREGIEVTILTTDPSQKLPTEEQVNGFQVLRVPAYPANRDYYFAPRIYDAVMQGDWDVMHCQGFHTFVPPVAMLAAKRKGIPYVLSFHSGGHSSGLRNSVRWIQAQMNRPLLAGASKLIAVSQYEARLFQKRLRLPADKFVVIPNGSQLPRLEKVPDPAENTLILSVGRLEKYKGHQRMIGAMPHILKQIPDAHLRILGTGPYEDDLRRMATELGVAERTEIGGIPPGNREAMAITMSQAALVTLMSDYEAHPLAVMEALSLQRPVLVADTSGLSELAERGFVKAIPVNSSPERIAGAAVKQITSPMPISRFELPTWETCAASLLSVYEAALEDRSTV